MCLLCLFCSFVLLGAGKEEKGKIIVPFFYVKENKLLSRRNEVTCVECQVVILMSMFL